MLGLTHLPNTNFTRWVVRSTTPAYFGARRGKGGEREGKGRGKRGKERGREPLGIR